MDSCHEKLELDKLHCTNTICKPVTAGKLFKRFGSVKECFDYPGADFDNRVLVPSYVPNITHGNSSQFSHPVGKLLNPNPNTRCQERLLDNSEHIYRSKINPLGKCKVPIAYKGEKFVPNTSQLYGVKTVFDEPAGILINPRKNFEQVVSEDVVAHDKYVKTHNDYDVGEPVNRKYDWKGRNPKFIKFGKETPHYNNGKNMALTLEWNYKRPANRHTNIVSDRLDAYTKKYHHQLGKVFEPNADVRPVGPDFAFGMPGSHDRYNAGDLVHMRDSDNILKGKDLQRGWVSCLRNHLKMANYHNFGDLRSAFKFYDSDNSGYIDPEHLRDACWKMNLPLDNQQLCLLMQYCSTEGNEKPGGENCKIDYTRFVNFLNWKEKYESLLPPSKTDYQKESEETKVETLKKQIDKALGGHFTTNSLYDHTAPFKSPVNTRRTFGLPTVRSDLPAPRIRRLSDRANYGDESDALGLISPSMCSTYGVYDRDFFLPRSRNEIRLIFDSIGVKMADETFDKVWNHAHEWSKTQLTHHKPGKVSVEAFRAVLDSAQSREIENANK